MKKNKIALIFLIIMAVTLPIALILIKQNQDTRNFAAGFTLKYFLRRYPTQCSWCGNSCIKKQPGTFCATVMPPENQACVTLNDGTCSIKGLGLIIPTSHSTPSCKSQNGICQKWKPGVKCPQNYQDIGPIKPDCNTKSTTCCVPINQ